MQAINLKRLIDHTNLQADASKEDITKLAQEAKTFGFNSICIRPKWVKEFSSFYKCCTVTSFPQEVFQIDSINQVKNQIGNFSYEEKSKEFKQAMLDRAFEIDPVINISRLEDLKEEMAVYYDAVMSLDTSVFIKPIFSCEILSDDELEFSIAKFSEFARVSQYENIRYCYKNSTGFIKSDNPELLKTTSKELVTKIKKYFDVYDPHEVVSFKIAGGIKSLEDIEVYQGICGDRLTHIGTSSGVKIFS